VIKKIIKPTILLSIGVVLFAIHPLISVGFIANECIEIAFQYFRGDFKNGKA